MPGSKLVGSFGPERDLDEQQLAEMRPAIEPAPRPRKPRVLREVTNGIVCFCNERFGEHQALEFMLHLRAEVGEELARVERIRITNRRAVDRYVARNRDDPEWVARRRALSAERTRRYRARKKAELAAADVTSGV